MRVAAATLIIAALYVLHQDFWWWNEPRPLVFGAMPIGLFYHAAYTAALPFVLWMLVRLVWPKDPEREPDPTVVSGFSRTGRAERETNRRR